MLVFYTWSIRLLADSISLFGAAEKVSWLANHTPQEAGRLAPPALPGSGDAGKPPKSTCGKVLPKADVSGVRFQDVSVGWPTCCPIAPLLSTARPPGKLCG